MVVLNHLNFPQAQTRSLFSLCSRKAQGKKHTVLCLKTVLSITQEANCSPVLRISVQHWLYESVWKKCTLPTMSTVPDSLVRELASPYRVRTFGWYLGSRTIISDDNLKHSCHNDSCTARKLSSRSNACKSGEPSSLFHSLPVFTILPKSQRNHTRAVLSPNHLINCWSRTEAIRPAPCAKYIPLVKVTSKTQTVLVWPSL